MRTEITIPFAFDTKPLEDKIQSDGYGIIFDELVSRAEKQLLQCMPKTYHDRNKIDWKAVIKDWMFDWLDENRDEVIDTAIILLAMKAKDKRRWSDVLKDIKED